MNIKGGANREFAQVERRDSQRNQKYSVSRLRHRITNPTTRGAFGIGNVEYFGGEAQGIS